MGQDIFNIIVLKKKEITYILLQVRLFRLKKYIFVCNLG